MGNTDKEPTERLLGEADDLERGGRYEEAIAIYDRLLEGQPTAAKLWAFRGYCNYCRDRLDEALKDFDRALELKPDAPSTLFFRARIRERTGSLQEALADYEKSAELSPRLDVLVNIGLINKFMGNLDRSLAAFRQALTLDPEDDLALAEIQELEAEIS
jgi:tetratricopeptide (TPR) repeat protein